MRTQNDRKLEELILLVASRSEGDPKFGAVKLNKLLFKIDFEAYRLLGKAVTGQEYFRLREGPAPRRMKPIMASMCERGDAAVRKVSSYGKGQDKTFALREPNLKLFAVEELDLIYQVIQHCWNSSGTDLSIESHRFAGWELAKEREVIPYSVSLVGPRRSPTPSEVEHGMSLEATALKCLKHAHASA